MSMSKSLEKAVNEQINHEFQAAYLYLAMCAYCRQKNFEGFGHWLYVQSQEEHGHAMKLYDFMDDWDGVVKLLPLEAPPVKFDSIQAVFQLVYEHEKKVTKQINKLYEIAAEEKAYGFQAQLQWFLMEQIEEEKVSRDLVAKLDIIGSDVASLLALDRELGARPGEASNGK